MPSSRRVLWIIYLAIAAILAIAFLRVRGEEGSVVVLARDPVGIMGTECQIRAIVGEGQEAAGEEAIARGEAALRRVEALMSTWLEDSEISRLNRASAGDTIHLAEESVQVLSASRAFAMQTDGAFDVTCRPLIEIWRRAGKNRVLPSSDEIVTARRESNWDGLALIEGGAVKSMSTVRVDLGGIAKGYGIDRAIDALRVPGCSGGLVDVGGDLRCFGRGPEAGRWRIEIRNPFADETWGSLSLTDRAVCTSGNYARFVEIDGVRYSHIVDPRTGVPADAVPSATIVAADAVTADAWATALSVLGEVGIDRIDPESGIEAMLILGTAESYTVVMTPGFEKLLASNPAAWKDCETTIRAPGRSGAGG